MTGLWALTKRNTKIYFKDKGMFFTSLITPVILLVLYITFLGNVYTNSFQSVLEAFDIDVPEKLLRGCAGGELVSSLLAVCCVTVAFCSNLLMIQDKSSGAKRDLTMTPIKSGTLALSYSLSTLVSTLTICLAAATICLGYLACVGWYLTVADVLMLLLDVVMLVLFGTGLASCVNFFLSTNGQASAVGTIVSAGYGFVCGAYMPISEFSEGLQKVLMFLPGTYGTSMLRNHALGGVFHEMERLNYPAEAIDTLRDAMDCNIYFFDNRVEMHVMYMVLLGAIILAFGLYLLINLLKRRKKA